MSNWKELKEKHEYAGTTPEKEETIKGLQSQDIDGDVIDEVPDGTDADGKNMCIRYKPKAQLSIVKGLKELWHLGGNGKGITVYNGIEVRGDPGSWLPQLWKEIIRKYDIKSMLDVGSGLGYTSQWFSDNGVESTAIEGLPYNVKYAVHPTILHDLSKSSFVPNERFDLVWCCEVAEHIKEEYVDYLLETITNCRVLFLTAAPPGADGHHHVNCRREDYWIKKLAKYGMKYSNETSKMKKLSNPHAPWCPQSHFQNCGMIFIKDN